MARFGPWLNGTQRGNPGERPHHRQALRAPGKRQSHGQRDQQHPSESCEPHLRSGLRMGDADVVPPILQQSRSPRPRGQQADEPPTLQTMADSASNRTETRTLSKPNVFSTASSRMRSRNPCAIVFALSSRSVHSTAPMTACTMRRTSALRDTYRAASALEVSVWVECPELTDRVSTARAIRPAA